MKNLWLKFKSRIQKRYPTMTVSERKIAEYMLEYPENVMTQSAKEIAEEANVSPASVVRFCKVCEYNGLPELKLELKREYIAEHEVSEKEDLAPDLTDEIIKQRTLGYHLSIVKALMADFDRVAFQYAVDEIMKAKRILVVGYGGSKAAAICFVDFLLQLHLSVEMWEDTSFCNLRINDMTSDDLVVAFTSTGRYMDTIRSVKLAHNKGITTIGFVGFLDSAITKYLSLVVSTSHNDSEFGESTLAARITELTAVEIIYMILSYRMGTAIETYINPNELLESLRLHKEEFD